MRVQPYMPYLNGIYGTGQQLGLSPPWGINGALAYFCGIAAVAGEPFGAPGHVRYSYAAAESVIDEALSVLGAAVASAKR